jgi:hypothetical protein
MTNASPRTSSPLVGAAATLWESSGKKGFVAFIRAAYPDSHAKRLARDFDVSPETSTTWLRGQRPNAVTFDRMVERWGTPFLTAIYGTRAADPDLCRRALAEAAAMAEDLSHRIQGLMIVGQNDPGADAARYARRSDEVARGCDEFACAGEGVAGRGGQDRSRHEGAPGKLLNYERLPLELAKPDHNSILEAWQESGGIVTDSLISAITASGLKPGMSVYTNESRCIQLGDVTSPLLTDAQRISLCGRHVRELPIDQDYARTVDHDIRDRAPLFTRVTLCCVDGARGFGNLRLPLLAAGRVISLTNLETFQCER